MTQTLHSRRSVLKGLAGAASTACVAHAFALAQTKPEVGSLVVAPQFGIIYLPLHVIKAEKLLEKHLTKNGLPNSKVDWVQMTSGAAANEALLSGNVHIVSGGSPPLLTIWDKTKGNADPHHLGQNQGQRRCEGHRLLRRDGTLSQHDQSARDDPQGFHG